MAYGLWLWTVAKLELWLDYGYETYMKTIWLGYMIWPWYGQAIGEMDVVYDMAKQFHVRMNDD